MRFYHLLSFRLFLLIILLLMILNIGFTLYYVNLESEQYEEVARQCAQRTSRIVAGATKNAMLLNQKESAYQIMNEIVRQDGIAKICLYDKEGNVAFSTSQAEIGKHVPFTHTACASCHESAGNLRDRPENKWHQLLRDSTGYRTLSYITPIQNEPGCYTADCHAHPRKAKFIGVLCVVLPLEKMDLLVEENQARMISTSLAITIFLGLAVGIFIWVWVHIPVNQLIRGTKAISSGNLDYSLHAAGKDEMGQLAKSFNTMTSELKKAKEEIISWSNQLEHRVKEKTEELEKTQKRNLQIEKMASLGQLSATVAHELNNPMAGILTYSKLIQKKLNKELLSEAEKQSVLKHLKIIEAESARSGDIVKNMLLFSRQEAVEMKSLQLNEVIESSLDLINHHLELHNIKLETDFSQDLPLVEIDENQIKQALLALYVNAVEAMDEDGTLTVKTRWKQAQGSVTIHVQDDGKGIPESVKSQIFEPFFTTKNAVKGVGLGLSAVYAIVQRHGGDITVDSKINHGTTFNIKLPLKKSRARQR